MSSVSETRQSQQLKRPATRTRDEVGQFTVKFDAKTYPTGQYVARAVLRDQQGYELDSQSVHMFVAQNPPLRAPFDLVPEDWSGFPDWRYLSHSFAATPEPKLNYNVKHPRYVDAESTGLEADLGFYLYGLMVQATIQFALYLGQTNPNGYAKIFNAKAMNSKEPAEIVKDTQRIYGIMLARWK